MKKQLKAIAVGLSIAVLALTTAVPTVPVMAATSSTTLNINKKIKATLFYKDNKGLSSISIKLNNPHTCSFSKFEVTKAATTNNDGEMRKKCSKCGKTVSKKIPRITTIKSKYTNEHLYTGKQIKPNYIINDAESTPLQKGKDYTITYKNNKKIGTATAIIKFKGKYTGTSIKKFKIVRDYGWGDLEGTDDWGDLEGVCDDDWGDLRFY